MLTRRHQSWRMFVAALVVATGLAVTWGAAFGWIASLVESFAGARPKVNEQLAVAADGTPVISVQSNEISTTVTLSRRALDGKEWPVNYEHWLGGAYLSPRRPAPGVIQLPIHWSTNERIGGMTDGRRPPTAWYIVRDAQPAGHCLLVGIDAISKLPIGYIGRNGYRIAEPGDDEQFSLPDTNEQTSAYVATPQYASWYQPIPSFYGMDEEGRPPSWFVYITESDRLWEIDLRQRTARVVLDAPGLLSVDIVTVLKSTVDAATSDEGARAQARPRIQFVSTGAPDAVVLFSNVPSAATNTSADIPRPKYAGAIGLRTDDKIIMFDPTSGTRQEFKLPAGVPNERVSAYWIAPKQLLLEYGTGYWASGPVSRLLWTRPDGTVERETELKLTGWMPDPPQANAWRMCGAVPVPIAWLIGCMLVAPLVTIQNHGAAGFAAALAHNLDLAWLPFVIVIVTAAVFAWLTIRLQQKYRRPLTGAWAVFVFLLGLPGFLAYLAEQRRPKMEACGECGTVVPRNRDECPACETPFAAPGRVGTEIFA